MTFNISVLLIMNAGGWLCKFCQLNQRSANRLELKVKRCNNFTFIFGICSVSGIVWKYPEVWEWLFRLFRPCTGHSDHFECVIFRTFCLFISSWFTERRITRTWCSEIHTFLCICVIILDMMTSPWKDLRTGDRSPPPDNPTVGFHKCIS